MHRKVPDEHRHFAKTMRADATLAENLLWQALRNRQLEGFKFKRQVPLDGYIDRVPRRGVAGFHSHR